MFKKFIGDKAFYHKLFTIMTPILIQNVITNFVSLLDNIMVGKVGTEPMSGVAVVNQLIFVFNLAIFGSMAGPGIFTAQFFGKDDKKGITNTFRIKLVVGTLVAIIFTLAFIYLPDNLIQPFLHESKEGLDVGATFNYAKAYLAVMIWQTIPFMLSQVYSSTLKETGETMVPMISGVVAVFVNLLFNYILIFGHFGFPALGVVGAAIATVISRYVELAIIVIYAHTNISKHPYFKGVYQSFKVPGELIAEVLKMSLPLFVNELLWSIGTTYLNKTYSTLGLEVVSAISISSTVSNLFFCSFFAMGASISIIIGQLLGAGQTEQAINEDRQLLFFSVVLCIVVGAIMCLCAPLFPEIYNTIPLVKKIATGLLMVSAILMPFHSFNNSCYFTLRAGGKTFITFIFDCGSIWILYIPLALYLTNYTNLDIIPVYAIVQSVEIIKCFIGYFMVKKKSWVNNLVKEY